MDVIEFMRQNKEYYEDFITRSTYHSNRIEGSTLSYPETYAILWNDDSMKIKATSRELYDAINHKYALTHALEQVDNPLSEQLIKDIAIQINRNINEIAGYRTAQAIIRGAEEIPPTASHVPQLMMQAVYEYNQQSGMDPFEREAHFHITFEHIHPFSDANGRTGRILINRGIIGAGYAPVVIDSDKRADYMDMLANYDYAGLSQLLREASTQEQSRIKTFQEASRPSQSLSSLVVDCNEAAAQQGQTFETSQQEKADVQDGNER